MGEIDRGWLRGKLGLVLMGRAMLSRYLTQFSVDGWSCVPFLLFDLRPNYGGGNEDNGDLLQKVPCTQCCTQYHQPCSSHRRPMPPVKVMSLFLNTLSRLVITFLPRSTFTFMAAVTIRSDFGAQKIKSDTVSTVSPLSAMKWWD